MSIDESTRFVISLFARHYRDSSMTPPERFSRREFGFMFFDRSFVIRHISFPTRSQLKKYLVDNVPSHVYYSSAYYEKPNAPTMSEKKWLGADLIFDLDADHIRGAEKLAYPEMLAKVKKEVSRLLDDFLLGDLGFSPNEVRIVFSGGRGYHVHVGGPTVTRLSSHERREIVDYITGTGLDIEWVFPPKTVEIGRFGERIHSVKTRRMPKITDGGWLTRVRKGVNMLLADLDGMSPQQRVVVLTEMFRKAGISTGEKSVKNLNDELFEGKPGKRGADRMRDEENFEVFSSDRHRELFLELIRKSTAIDIAGETDEPVTSDTKRLIRLPGSIHGKTGFEVVPMSRDELDSFNPFDDAVPKAFGSQPVRVVCDKPVQVRLKGDSYSLDQGQNEVPEYVAIHLVCRRLAKLGE